MSKAVVLVFCKKGILKIFAKKPVLESLFNIRLQRLQRRCFLCILQNFKFVEHLGTVASETLHNKSLENH